MLILKHDSLGIELDLNIVEQLILFVFDRFLGAFLKYESEYWDCLDFAIMIFIHADF